MPRPDKPELIPILTCSARDYAEMQNRDLTSYIPYGPIWFRDPECNTVTCEASIREQAFNKNCEALVDTKYSVSTHMSFVAATGLILRTEKDEEKPELK